MKVMIIEDEEIAATYCAKLISSYGHDINIVTVCRDGRTAKEKFQLIKPDVIFADIRLGKDNGLDIISDFREQGWNGKLIIMSVYNNFDFIRRAIHLEVMDYLLKPIFKDDVFKILDNLVLFFDKKDNSPAQKISNISMQDVPIYLQKALEYISLNYGEKISLKEISDNSCVSKTYLSMSFSKYLGLTFIEYLNAYRIEIAKNMLLLSSASISDIAENVGIPDIVYFSKLFKKITGVSPGRFRNENSIKGIRIDD